MWEKIKKTILKFIEAKDPQKKNAFDKATLIKILKGALIAASGAFALFILSWLQTLQFTNEILTLFMAWFVPTAINALKEYRKGV